MRRWTRIGLGGLFAVIAGCGGAEPSTEKPSPTAPPESDAAPAALDLDDPEVEAAQASEAPSPALPEGPRIALAASFHRTRVGPQGGFWVLGEIANPSEQPVVDVRPSVRLLDIDGELALEVHGQARPIEAGASEAFVLLVATPVEHETIEVSATGLASEGPLEPVPSLTLDHDEPTRAKLGGYFVLGQLSNEGGVSEGQAVQIEVRAYDGSDELLGVDWFASAAPPPGESAPFDLGGLRYEEVPKRFELDIVRPAPNAVPDTDVNL